MKATHYLSVVAVLLGTIPTAMGANPVVETLPASGVKPTTALAEGPLYQQSAQQSPPTTPEALMAMEDSITNMLRAREEALAQRYRTNFTVPTEAPRPDRLQPMQQSLTMDAAKGDINPQPTPGRAFQVPGDSLMLVSKDYSINGSLYSSVVTAKQDGDSIALYNVYGWGAQAGYRAPRAYVSETGAVTIPAQLILNHSTYGAIWIAPMEQRDGSLVYSLNPITGQMDAQGNITVSGWGIFVPAGERAGTLFNAFSSSEWKPANATYRSPRANNDEVVTGYALIEQTSQNEVALYNIAGGDYGEVIYARIYSNNTGLISPQKIFTNAMLGDFYCYPATYEGTTAKVDMKGNLQITTTDSGFTIQPWAITARGASNYAAAYFLNTFITTAWRPQWPESHPASFQGKGTQAEPYKLASANDFASLAEAVNTGNQAYATAWYELASDIDWNSLSYAFEPIGSDATPFYGHLDGKSHTIKNFTYNGRGFTYAGLFGVTGLNSTISNLNMTGVDVIGGGRFTASLAANSWSTISNVHVEGQIVSRGECVGGLVSTSSAPISDSSFKGNGTSGGSWGGIAGDSYASIIRCHTDVDIATIGYISTLYKYLGGIAGTAMCSTNVSLPVEITDCYVSGTLTDRLGYAGIGGIVATLANGATINRCFNTATISGKRLETSDTEDPCAGIVGWAREGSVTNCYNSGNVIKTGTTTMVSGIVGYLSVGYISSGNSTTMTYMCKVSNCYNSGQITSSSTSADKGIYGTTFYHEGFDPISACISNCYNDSQVTGLKGSQYDLPTSSFTGGQHLPNFDGSLWNVSAGYYPTLKTITDCAAVRLSSVALRLADNENSRKMKSTAQLSQAQDIIWKLYDNGQFVDDTQALSISGNNLTVKDRYSNSVLVAMGTDNAMRMFSLSVVPKAFDGSGTAEDPYLIKNVADFRKLNEAIGTYGQPHEGDYFRMTNDIDFALAATFQGVGARLTPAIGFGGVFDGQGHAIHGLHIEAVAYDGDGTATTTGSYAYSGLFNNILASGIVKNLVIASDCSFSHWGPGGSISGYNMGTIENCRSYAAQKAITDYLGGITGYNTGTVRGCYNSGNLTFGRLYTGGIAGVSTGLIELCQNDGDVTGAQFNPYITSTVQNSVGGITGATAGDNAMVKSCLNQGTITAARQMGGIVGVSTACIMSGNINTGLLNSWGTDATKGAMVGNLSKLEGEGNYFDGSTVICQAVSSTGRPGFTPLSTVALISGTAPAELPNAQAWQFEAGAYPVLKAFANESLSKTLSHMYVKFGDNETRANVQHSTPLSTAQGLTYTLSGIENSLFSISGSNLNVTPPQGSAIGTDTLTITATTASRVLPLQTVPVLFQGAGTLQSPYEIRTVDDVNRLSEFMYATGFDYSNTYFKVMNDITFAATDTISQIAKGGVHSFNGDFDGNGKTISGFKYENTVITNTAAKPHPLGYAGRYMGFFGKIGSSGNVHDLTLNGEMNIYSYLGGLAGDVYGIVENCKVFSKLSTTSAGYVGGIVSRLYTGGVVKNCTFGGNITSKTTNNGGIAAMAYAETRIEDCTMTGSLAGTSTNAGIVSSLYGTVKGCKVTKDATFNTATTFGGIAAQLYTTALVEDCENYANLAPNVATATDYSGIVAKTTTKGINVKIRRCTNYGNITAKSYASGIVSRLLAGNQVEDCVNYGTITSTGASQTGGIVANTATAQEDYPLYIRRCINYGEIHGFASYIGGVSGDVGTASSIDSCLNYGDIYSTATSSHLAVGGVTGVLRGTMTRCMNAGNLYTVGHGTGGVAGLVQSGVMESCANLGNVTSTGEYPASKNGMVGSLVGYTVTQSAFYNSYNMGNLTGPLNMGGLIGRAAASTSTPDVPLENCYTFGKLTITNDSIEDAVSANLFVRNTGVNVVWKNIYYNSDVNPNSYRYDPSGRGRTEQELQTVELGEAYMLDRAMLPRLTWLAGNDAADVAAISTSFTGTDAPNNIRDIFYVGYPKDGLIWELSDHFRMSSSDPGKVYPVKTGAGTIKVSSPDGKFTRTFNLTASGTVSVEEFGIDAATPVSTEYFDLQGIRVVNPVLGSIVIERIVYSDGTTKTRKIVIK